MTEYFIDLFYLDNFKSEQNAVKTVSCQNSRQEREANNEF